jgi:alpha-ketoglutarate-dependent taurine dioxygenase
MALRISPLGPFGVLVEPDRPGADLGQVDLEALRALVRDEHLVALRGFRTFDTAEAFVAYCERWGAISVWPFGKVLELVEQPQPEDHIFDHRHVPLHWDGMYRPQVPELQVFHCVSAPGDGQGGRTTFSNTRGALARASAATREAWAGVEGVYARRMAFYDSRTVAPIVTAHPTRGYPVIRYCEPPDAADPDFVNHPDITLRGVAEAEAAGLHQSLRAALHDPACLYAHAWRTGDVVVADNHTLLHGREAFTSGAPRHLRRVHVLGEVPLANPHLVTHA